MTGRRLSRYDESSSSTPSRTRSVVGRVSVSLRCTSSRIRLRTSTGRWSGPTERDACSNRATSSRPSCATTSSRASRSMRNISARSTWRTRPENRRAPSTRRTGGPRGVRWARARAAHIIVEVRPRLVRSHWNAYQSDHVQGTPLRWREQGARPESVGGAVVEQVGRISRARRARRLRWKAEALEHEADGVRLGHLAEHAQTTSALGTCESVHLECALQKARPIHAVRRSGRCPRTLLDRP